MNCRAWFARLLTGLLCSGVFTVDLPAQDCALSDAEFYTSVRGIGDVLDRPFVNNIVEQDSALRNIHVRIAASAGPSTIVEVVGQLETWEQYYLSTYTTLTYQYCIHTIKTPPTSIHVVPVQINIKGQVAVSPQLLADAYYIVEYNGGTQQWRVSSDDQTKCGNISRRVTIMTPVDTPRDLKVWAMGQWSMNPVYPGPWPRISTYRATGRVSIDVDPAYEYADYLAVALSANLLPGADFDDDGDIDLRDFGIYATAPATGGLTSNDDYAYTIVAESRRRQLGGTVTPAPGGVMDLIATMTGPITFDPSLLCP